MRLVTIFLKVNILSRIPRNSRSVIKAILLILSKLSYIKRKKK